MTGERTLEIINTLCERLGTTVNDLITEVHNMMLANSISSITVFVILTIFSIFMFLMFYKKYKNDTDWKYDDFYFTFFIIFIVIFIISFFMFVFDIPTLIKIIVSPKATAIEKILEMVK